MGLSRGGRLTVALLSAWTAFLVLDSEPLVGVLIGFSNLLSRSPHCNSTVPTSYSFILLPRGEAGPGPLIVYVSSLPHEFGLRSAARQTWIAGLRHPTPVIFVLGRPSDRLLQLILIVESLLYADILQVNMCETLETEILKTHALLSHHLYFRKGFDSVLAARAQTLLRPSAVAALAGRGNASAGTIHCLFSRHSSMFQGVEEEEWGGCSGHVYVLGSGVGERLWTEAPRWPRRSGEDVFFTGLVPSQAGLPRLHSTALLALSVGELGEDWCVGEGLAAVTSVEGPAQMRATWSALREARPCPIVSPA